MNKRVKGSVIGAIVVLIIFLFFCVPIIAEKYTGNWDSAADGFEINQYDVDIELFRNNTAHIKENITVLWTESGHHGIYRFMPTWLKYTDKTGKTKSRKMNIRRMTSDDAYGMAELVGKNKLKLKMGSPYITEEAGSVHTYTINYYGCDFGNDPYKGFDEFIFHAYGDYWGTRINEPSVKITLPDRIENIDGFNIRFFADKYRRNDISQFVDCEIDGNTIIAHVNSNYNLSKSLTVDIELPEGYFKNTNNIYNSGIPVIICLLIVLIQIVLYCLLPIIGKNYPKVKETIEYEPPDGLDPAQIGYIYKNGETGQELLVPLIVSIASKGYIRIDLDDTKKYVIYNLYIEPGKKYRNSNNIPVPKGTTYTAKEKLKPLSKCEKLVYDKLFEKEDVNVITDDKEFYKIELNVNKVLKDETEGIINDKISTNMQIFSIWTSVFSIILMIIVFFIMDGINPKYSVVYTLGWIASFSSIIPAIFMGRKTMYGEQIVARVNGYKRYLENIKKEDIESLIDKNQNIYYDILPYAYIFGITTVWMEKFQETIIPEEIKRRYGNINYYDHNLFYNIHREIRTGTYSSGGSSSGCSSCGGGCSSCGGGCSSCGGGGSW